MGHLWCIDMDKRGDVSPELVTDYSVWPPVTKPNPNSAKVWHYGGPSWPRQGEVRAEILFRPHHVHLSPFTTISSTLRTGRALSLSRCQYGQDLLGARYPEHHLVAPLWADNKVYLGTDEGEIWIFAHGKEKKLLGHPDVNTYHIRAAPRGGGRGALRHRRQPDFCSGQQE